MTRASNYEFSQSDYDNAVTFERMRSDRHSTMPVGGDQSARIGSRRTVVYRRSQRTISDLHGGKHRRRNKSFLTTSPWTK